MTEANNIQIEAYGGKVRIKRVETNWGHSYYISLKKGSAWGPWERKTGVTTFIGIKDKSGPMKFWVAKIMYKFLISIKSTRDITVYDIKEAKDLHVQRLKDAATTGTKIHDYIESETKGEKPDMPQEENVLVGVNAWNDWKKQLKIKIKHSEMPLYSLKYDYCGTADAIITIGNKDYLLDYKTSKDVYSEVFLQTAAYAKAYEEMGYGKLHGRWEVRLEKRTEQEFEEEMNEKGLVNAEFRPFEAINLEYAPDAYERDFKGFLSARDLYLWNKPFDGEEGICKKIPRIVPNK